MSIISHDLKNSSYIRNRLCKAGKNRDPPWRKKTKRKVFWMLFWQKVKRILKMLDSILTWQQIEADKIKLFYRTG